MEVLQSDIGVLGSSTAAATDKKGACERIGFAVRSRLYGGMEVQLVDALVKVIENSSNLAELRCLASDCLSGLAGRLSTKFPSSSLMHVSECVVGVLHEGAQRLGNLKNDPNKFTFACILRILGVLCDHMPNVGRDALAHVLSLWIKAADGGSVSICREAMLCVLRMYASNKHRFILDGASNKLLVCIGKTFRSEFDQTQVKKILHLLRRSGELCRSKHDAILLEKHSVVGLMSSTDVMAILDCLELFCHAAGRFSLAVMLEKDSRSWALLKEAMELELSMTKAWAMWCKACLQAEALPMVTVLSTFHKAFVDSKSIAAALHAITATKGFWNRVVVCCADDEVAMAELTKVVTAFLKGATTNIEMFHEVWQNLIGKIFVREGTLLRSVCMQSVCYKQVCEWIFRGVIILACKNDNCDVRKLVADEVNDFVSAFVASLKSLLRQNNFDYERQKRDVTNIWIECRREKSSKLILNTGLGALRKIISSDSVNINFDRVKLYNTFVRMALFPTLDVLLAVGSLNMPVMSLPLLILRCRVAEKNDSLENSILIDFAQSLKQIVDAQRCDTVEQLVLLSREVEQHLRTLRGVRGVIFRLSAWKVLATECVAAVVTDVTDRKVNVFANLDVVVSGFVSIVLSVFEQPFSQPDEELIASWRSILHSAKAPWMKLLSWTGTESLTTRLIHVVNKSWLSLLKCEQEHVHVMVCFGQEACDLFCGEPFDRLSQQVLTAQTDLSCSTVAGFCSYLASMSQLLHLQVCRVNSTRLIQCAKKLCETAAGVCSWVQLQSYSCCGSVLQNLMALFDVWMTSSSTLVTATIAMIEKCYYDSDPPIEFMCSWFSACLRSNRKSISDPVLAFWNHYLCKRKKIVWTPNWVDVIQAAHSAMGSDFSVPEGLIISRSVVVTKRARVENDKDFLHVVTQGFMSLCLVERVRIVRLLLDRMDYESVVTLFTEMIRDAK